MKYELPPQIPTYTIFNHVNDKEFIISSIFVNIQPSNNLLSSYFKFTLRVLTLLQAETITSPQNLSPLSI